MTTLTPAKLEKLRALCLAVPDAAEKEAWGDPTWRVRDKLAQLIAESHALITPKKKARR